jgi:hypothetical protein
MGIMGEDERPLLRVVRGVPDDDELAALTAVVASVRGRRGKVEPTTSRSRWADRTTLVRPPLPFGPGAWRASGLPR